MGDLLWMRPRSRILSVDKVVYLKALKQKITKEAIHTSHIVAAMGECTQMV